MPPRRRPTALPPNLAARLQVRGELLPAVLRALGARFLPAVALAPDVFGPPAPAMLAANASRIAVRPRIAPAPPPIRADNPFAALAALRLP